MPWRVLACALLALAAAHGSQDCSKSGDGADCAPRGDSAGRAAAADARSRADARGRRVENETCLALGASECGAPDASDSPPTDQPTEAPTDERPTVTPTETPTETPTDEPTAAPAKPANEPTRGPGVDLRKPWPQVTDFNISADDACADGKLCFVAFASNLVGFLAGGSKLDVVVGDYGTRDVSSMGKCFVAEDVDTFWLHVSVGSDSGSDGAFPEGKGTEHWESLENNQFLYNFTDMAAILSAEQNAPAEQNAANPDEGTDEGETPYNFNDELLEAAGEAVVAVVGGEIEPWDGPWPCNLPQLETREGRRNSGVRYMDTAEGERRLLIFRKFRGPPQWFTAIFDETVSLGDREAYNDAVHAALEASIHGSALVAEAEELDAHAERLAAEDPDALGLPLEETLRKLREYFAAAVQVTRARFETDVQKLLIKKGIEESVAARFAAIIATPREGALSLSSRTPSVAAAIKELRRRYGTNHGSHRAFRGGFLAYIRSHQGQLFFEMAKDAYGPSDEREDDGLTDVEIATILPFFQVDHVHATATDDPDNFVLMFSTLNNLFDFNNYMQLKEEFVGAEAWERACEFIRKAARLLVEFERLRFLWREDE